MIAIILFCVVSLAIFVYTLAKLIRDKNWLLIIVIVIELIGIISNGIFMLSGKKIPEIIYAFNVFFSIIIPIGLFIIEKKGIQLGELLYLARANADKENMANILVDALEHYPDSLLIHKKFLKLYLEKGAKGDAEDEYLKLISLEPNNNLNYMELANLYREDRKFNEAINVLEEIYNDNLDNLEICKLLGDTYYDAGRFEDALGVYGKALQSHPESFDLYYAMGMTYTMLNDFNNAKEYYNKAAKINSYRDEVANLNLGQILYIIGEYDEAQKFFEKLIMSDDDKISANAYYNLAKIKIIKGERELAIKYCNLAIELDPEIKTRISNDKRFEIILEKLHMGKEKAIHTRTSQKERQIINYLNKNFELQNNSSDKKEVNQNEEIERDY